MISSNGYMIPIAFSKKNKNVFLSCNNNDSKVNKKKDTDKINNSGDITINNDNSNSNSSNSININKKKKKISIKNNIQQKGYNANVYWRSISMADLRQQFEQCVRATRGIMGAAATELCTQSVYGSRGLTQKGSRSHSRRSSSKRRSSQRRRTTSKQQQRNRGLP
jgi:hypothetical protein